MIAKDYPMNGFLRMAWTLFVLGLLALPYASQEDPFVRCTRCQNKGQRICKEHKKSDCLLEDNVLYCSLLGACEVCGGAGWIDCKDCENPAVEARLAKKLARLPMIQKQLAHYSEEMQRPLAIARSEHFVLVVEIQVAKVAKKKLRKHALLHLYVDRMETLYGDFMRLLHVDPGKESRLSTVLIWDRMDEHMAASTRYTGQVADGGVKLMGVRPVYSVAFVPRLFSGDRELHRNVVHNVTHLLLSSLPPVYWVGNRKGGWADEGLAHWFEDYYFQICDNYCFQETDTSAEFKGGKWRPGLRKELAGISERVLPSLFEQNTDTLSLFQHAAAFGIVDYLMKQDGDKLRAIFDQMRRKQSTRDALSEVLGLSVLKLEGRWRDWIKSTYLTR